MAVGPELISYCIQTWLTLSVYGKGCGLTGRPSDLLGSGMRVVRLALTGHFSLRGMPDSTSNSTERYEGPSAWYGNAT